MFLSKKFIPKFLAVCFVSLDAYTQLPLPKFADRLPTGTIMETKNHDKIFDCFFRAGTFFKRHFYIRTERKGFR